LTFLKSRSRPDPDPDFPEPPPSLSGVVLPPDLPAVLLANNALAAGVRSLAVLFGVNPAVEGGAMSPFVLGVLVEPANIAALSRKLLPALALRRKPVCSRLDGGLILKGVGSKSIPSAGSPPPSRVEERIRGVERSVPIVINSFNAAGPS
jgi:hypothetical protein